MKKALFAIALTTACMASPAAAASFKYQLDNGGFIMIDNASGEVVLQDAQGNQSFGRGESFKSWKPNEPFDPGARCNGICPNGANKFKFDSINGSFNGRDIAGSALVVGFRSDPNNPSFNKVSIWTPRGDIHVQPQQAQIIGGSSTSSGGSGSSGGGSSSGASSSGGAPLGASSSGASSSGGSSGGSSSGGSSGGVDVPAPGVLGLFALALAAIGLGRCRRKGEA